MPTATQHELTQHGAPQHDAAQQAETGRRTGTDRILRLADGRRAGVSLFGDPQGTPVFMLHGTPASRITFQFLDGTAADLGVLVIAPDRPGIGLSDDLANRGILDYPADIAEIADALQLDTFAVAGWSGGAAYALACAAALPGRVRSAGVISGLAPLEATGSLDGLGRSEREALRLTHVAPWLAKPFYRCLAAFVRRWPRLAVRAIRQSLADGDRRLVSTDEATKLTAFFLEACRQGSRGIVLDFRLFTYPWGFGLEDLDVPVHIFHGENDETIPVHHGRTFARSVPDASLTIWEDEGHLGLWLHADEVLKALV